MEENGLRSLNNLFPLRHLKSLHLGMNRIVEVAELEKLAAHTELVEITLGNSPVARKQVRSPPRFYDDELKGTMIRLRTRLR